MAQRNPYIDVARGIGIFFVCLGHVLRGLEKPGLYSSIEFFHISDVTIYSFHMPMFFLFSGMTFYFSLKKSYGEFLLNRTLDIFLVYLAWSSIQGVIKTFFNSWVNNPQDPDFLVNILVRPHSQFWFLHTLFILSIFWGSFFKLLPNIKTNLLLMVVLITWFITNDFYLWYSIFLIGGIALGHQLKMPHRKAQVAAGIALSTFVVVLLWRLNFISETDSGYIFRLVKLNLAVLGSATFLFFAFVLTNRSAYPEARRSFFSIQLENLGLYSMQIYLLHIFLGSGIRIALLKLEIRNLAIHIIAGTFMGLYASLAIAKIFEKMGYNFIFRPSLLLKKRSSFKT